MSFLAPTISYKPDTHSIHENSKTHNNTCKRWGGRNLLTHPDRVPCSTGTRERGLDAEDAGGHQAQGDGHEI